MSSPTLSHHRLRSRPAVAPEPVPPSLPEQQTVPDRPVATELSDAARAAALETEVAQLRAAMASRAAIEQAKGILMLLTGCSDQSAFELLAHISGHTHRKLRDVARSITASATGASDLPADIRAILRDACPPRSPR